MDMLAPQDPLDVRAWNGTPISRRTTDGYVNATAMCKANGKEWSTYARTESAKRYIAGRKAALQNCRTELVQSIHGGVPTRQGTWIHPRLAVDLARWISTPFAMWMDDWLLDEIERQAAKPTITQPQISGTSVLNLLKESADFIRDLGCFDDRDKILFSDLARNNAMRVNSDFLLPPGEEEMALSDAYMELFQRPLARDKASIIGKFVANNYRKQFDKEPPMRIQYVDGAPRKVKSYKKNWLLKTLKLFKE